MRQDACLQDMDTHFSRDSIYNRNMDFLNLVNGNFLKMSLDKKTKAKKSKNESAVFFSTQWKRLVCKAHRQYTSVTCTISTTLCLPVKNLQVKTAAQILLLLLRSRNSKISTFHYQNNQEKSFCTAVRTKLDDSGNKVLSQTYIHGISQTLNTA